MNWGRPSHELFAAPLLLWLPEEYTDVGPEGAAEKLLDPQGPLGAAVESALRYQPPFPFTHVRGTLMENRFSCWLCTLLFVRSVCWCLC